MSPRPAGRQGSVMRPITHGARSLAASALRAEGAGEGEPVAQEDRC
jgi:hypothetical protein